MGRAGSSWRVLAHVPDGDTVAVETSPRAVSAPGYTVHDVSGTIFDELVVDGWLHVEEMSTGQWWLDVGGVVLVVDANHDGRPARVWVFGPGDYSDRREGCEYRLKWSGGQGG